MILCSATERPGPLVDRVDVVEVNHFYDGSTGKLTFDQIIWYDWNPYESRYDVVDWRLLKGVRGEIVDQEALKKHRAWPDKFPPPDPEWLGGHATPLPDYRLKIHVSLWHDEKCRGVLRRVEAKMYRETWTVYDPELTERENLPQEKRRELRKHEVQQRAQPRVR